jgi:hypothetical protein
VFDDVKHDAGQTTMKTSQVLFAAHDPLSGPDYVLNKRSRLGDTGRTPRNGAVKRKNLLSLKRGSYFD